MLRVLWTLVAAIAFTAISDVSSHPIDSLQVGDYYKPTSSEVSGEPNNTAKFSRSPCPALNTLVNHGFMERTGRCITREMMKAAVKTYFNMAEDTATRQVSRVPDVISLDLLGIQPPNHDASLVRPDLYFRHDPSKVSIKLARDLLDRADSNGMIDTAAVASVRKKRASQCEALNPVCVFGETEKNVSFGQAANLLLGLGDGDAISYAHAKSFLIKEKFPKDFVKSAKPVTLAAISAKSAELVELVDGSANQDDLP